MQRKPFGYRQQEFLGETPPENSPFTNLKSFRVLLKAFGLIPMYEVTSNYEVGPPTKGNKLYAHFVRGTLIVFTAFVLYILIIKYSHNNQPDSSRETDFVNSWVELSLMIVNFLIIIFISTCKDKSFVKIINEVLQVDEKINRQCGVILGNNCELLSKYFFTLLVLELFWDVLKWMTQDEKFSLSGLLTNIFLILQWILLTNFIVYVLALLRIVTVRFAFVNTILNEYSYKTQELIKDSLACDGDEVDTMENFPEDSAFALRLHTQLLGIMKSINDFCSFFLVTFMSFAFYTITTAVYNVFIEFTTKPQISAIFIQKELIWMMAHAGKLVLLCNTCDQITSEAKTTSRVMARVYSKNREHRNIIDKFLTKSLKAKIQFTACGFFTINKSTLFKTFCAITTYLVILIQFKQLEDVKREFAESNAD